MSRHWHLTVSDTHLSFTASTVRHRQSRVADCGLQSGIKTRGVCLKTQHDRRSPWPCCPGPTCSRRTCSPWCDSTGTPLRENSSHTDNADQSHLNKHGQLTSVNSSTRQRGVEHLVGERGGERGRAVPLRLRPGHRGLHGL